MATMNTACIYRAFCFNIRCCSFNTTRYFHTSRRLEHDPNLKKKKKAAIDQAKEKFRKERQAAKRKAEPIVIPTDPDSVPDPLLMESNRKRNVSELSPEVKEERILLSKEWARHTMKSHREELHKLQLRSRSRQDALRELKKISVDLYDEAIKVNRSIFPLVLTGPVETPPLEGYIAPDLDDINVKQSKKS